ncbi:4-coumarate--CoA ligase 1-like protein, partial [Dinothrombium tinctorium]
MKPTCRGTTELKSVCIPSYEVEIKIVDPEMNSELGANKTGEICVKSQQDFKGYLNDHLLTKAQFNEEGFFKTSDAGYYDVNGYVYSASRFSSLLKYDSWLFSTIELEDILQQHVAVKEVAVIGIDAGR